MAPLTAFSHTVLDPDELPDAIGRAFAVFSGSRPRPVHIEIPLDVLDMPAEFPIKSRPQVGYPAPAPEAIEEAARLIRDASNPFVIIGGGANRVGPAMLKLVELIGGPVSPTKAGKGTIPDTHPLSLGANLIVKSTRDILAKADVVYIGEAHTIRRHHELQLRLLQELFARGVPLTLCLEQLEAADQPAVDRYARGETDFASLVREIGWDSPELGLWRSERVDGLEVFFINDQSGEFAHAAPRGCLGLPSEE